MCKYRSVIIYIQNSDSKFKRWFQIYTRWWVFSKATYLNEEIYLFYNQKLSKQSSNLKQTNLLSFALSAPPWIHNYKGKKKESTYNKYWCYFSIHYWCYINFSCSWVNNKYSKGCTINSNSRDAVCDWIVFFTIWSDLR